MRQSLPLFANQQRCYIMRWFEEVLGGHRRLTNISWSAALALVSVGGNFKIFFLVSLLRLNRMRRQQWTLLTESVRSFNLLPVFAQYPQWPSDGGSKSSLEVATSKQLEFCYFYGWSMVWPAFESMLACHAAAWAGAWLLLSIPAIMAFTVSAGQPLPLCLHCH